MVNLFSAEAYTLANTLLSIAELLSYDTEISEPIFTDRRLTADYLWVLRWAMTDVKRSLKTKKDVHRGFGVRRWLRSL